MNCRHCQRDMSECLDGRLPSGRRASVMQHIETCEECSQLWGEFQRAQELILRLPARKVSADFHDRLWERIKAGEGTPEAVFNEPMPLATKARYVLTGAAAAALLIVLLNVWDAGGGEAGSTSLRESPPVTAFSGFSELSDRMPLEPRFMAEEAARVVAANQRRLNENYLKLLTGPQGRVDESTYQVILRSAGAVKIVGGILLRLHRDEYVEMPPETAFTLHMVESSLDVNKLKAMRDAAELRNSLSGVIPQLHDLDRLLRQIKVGVVYLPEEQRDFLQKVYEMYHRNSELMEYIPVEVFGQSGLPARDFEIEVDPSRRNRVQIYIRRERPR